jgi:hypothetical protein
LALADARKRYRSLMLSLCEINHGGHCKTTFGSKAHGLTPKKTHFLGRSGRPLEAIPNDLVEYTKVDRNRQVLTFEETLLTETTRKKLF